MFDYDGDMDRFAHVEDLGSCDTDDNLYDDDPFYDPDGGYDDACLGWED